MTNYEIMIDELAKEVMKGTFGNGNEREYRLGNLYLPVQTRVNEIMYKKITITNNSCIIGK